MRQVLKRPLWIGHAGDLRSPRELLNAGIQAVVELADNEQLASLPRDLVRFRFPLSDGGENPDWLLRLAVDSVSALISASVPTLICCSCGMNRSVCVAAAAVAKSENLNFEEALSLVTMSGPADVSPGLAMQFQSMFSKPA